MSLALLSVSCLAWLAFTDKNEVNNLNFTVDRTNIEYSEIITVTRRFGHNTIVSTYKRDTDGKYYLYADGNYVLTNEEKTSISLMGLLPTEYMDFHFEITGLPNTNYKLDFLGLTGDTFVINSQEEVGGVMQTVSTTYSILGIYRFNQLTYDSVSSTYVEGESKWFSTFSPLEIKTSLNAINGVMDSTGSATIDFRITIDLSNYRMITGAGENILSEAEIGITELRLTQG